VLTWLVVGAWLNDLRAVKCASHHELVVTLSLLSVSTATDDFSHSLLETLRVVVVSARWKKS